MPTIMTYDIPDKHREFKEMMFKMGYEDKISDDVCGTIYLPNTTLYHPTKLAVAARNDAIENAKSLGVVLERCISTIWSGWAVICGEPFK